MPLYFILASSAHASQKVDIYHAEILVKNASDSERKQAAQATLGEVIVRVSGQTSALQNPLISQAIAKAQNYLFGFSYEASTEKLVRDGKTFAGVKLLLNYSPQAIEQLLREAQLPLWPATRPKLLVWLVAKDQSGFHLVPEVADSAALQAQAKLRGLPLLRPAMDLEDSLSLSADDLWRLDIAKIQAASARYRADAILVGRYLPSALGEPIPAPVDALAAAEQGDVSDAIAASTDAVPVTPSMGSDTDSATEQVQNLGPWQSDWQLLTASQESFTTETPQISGLFQAAVDYAADYFAGVYAIKPNASGPQVVTIKIGNVASFGAFKQVQAYVNDLVMVTHTDFVRANADGLWLRLTIDGDIKLLMETLALGKRLAPIATDSIQPLTTAVAQPVDTQGNIFDTPAAPSNGVADADVEASINAEIAREFGVEPSVEVTTPSAPQFVPPQAGSDQDPLLYTWQK